MVRSVGRVLLIISTFRQEQVVFFLYNVTGSGFTRPLFHSKLNDAEGIYEIKDYICPILAIVSHTEKHDVELFSHLYEALPMKEDELSR